MAAPACLRLDRRRGLDVVLDVRRPRVEVGERGRVERIARHVRAEPLVRLGHDVGERARALVGGRALPERVLGGGEAGRDLLVRVGRVWFEGCRGGVPQLLHAHRGRERRERATPVEHDHLDVRVAKGRGRFRLACARSIARNEALLHWLHASA